MKFRVVRGSKVLTAVEVEGSEPVSLVLETEGGSQKLGIDLMASGGIKVGYWPDGEAWRTVLEYSGD